MEGKPLILCDTREKEWDNVRRWFDRNGVDYIRCKLDTGDYMLYGNNSISIDRKRNLAELSKNLMNAKDHSRFWKEVRRAKESGMRLVVLCEHGGGVKSIKDVAKWRDKYSGVSGRALMDEIYRVHISYGVEFLFCDKRTTGRRIVEILTGGAKDEP